MRTELMRTELIQPCVSLSGMGRGAGAGWTAVLATVGALGLGALTVLAVTAEDQWPAEPPRPAAGAADEDLQQLVGTWQVMGAPAIEGRGVRLSAGGRVSLREGACLLWGRWSATDSGLMIMNFDAATNECRDLDDAFEYFTGVQRYDLMQGAVRLANLSGSTVAVLSDRTSPADSDETIAPRDTAPELPLGVRTPSLEMLTAGRWMPVETVGSDRWGEERRPHARFDTDGTWQGSDGCNGLGGRWSMDAQTGEWLAGTLGQTEIGCDNVDVSAVVGPARAVGIDGDELVFFGADGSETGRFVAEEG